MFESFVCALNFYSKIYNVKSLQVSTPLTKERAPVTQRRLEARRGEGRARCRDRRVLKYRAARLTGL